MGWGAEVFGEGDGFGRKRVGEGWLGEGDVIVDRDVLVQGVGFGQRIGLEKGDGMGMEMGGEGFG